MSRLFNLEAESALLGGVLTNSQWMGAANLRPEHFYAHEHGAIWEELQTRYRDGRLIDLVSMRPWAQAQAALQPMGGATYLMDLMMRPACMAAQVAEYAAMIRDCARRRAVAGAAREAIGRAEQSDEDALTSLEARLQAIAADDADADAWLSAADLAASGAERAELGEAKGLSTGFPSLDRATGGIQPGTLWVVGGATSMGKSVFGAALARNVAAQGRGAAEIHLEMDATQIGLRTATALAFRVEAKEAWDNPHYLSALRGDMRREQWARLREGVQRAGALPLYQDPRPGRTVAQIEAAARRLFRKMEREGVTPGVLVIDHEGLIPAEQRHPSQLEAANARAAALLGMAKRLNVAVVALSQITKEGSRADGDERLPTAQDLNYGSALSQAASVVILLHRPAYFAERKPEKLRNDKDWDALKSRECVLVVDKSRGGRRQHVTVWMDMPTAAVWAEDAA